MCVYTHLIINLFLLSSYIYIYIYIYISVNIYIVYSVTQYI